MNANEYSFILFLVGIGHFFNKKLPNKKHIKVLVSLLVRSA